jgi:hypothetical protein
MHCKIDLAFVGCPSFTLIDANEMHNTVIGTLGHKAIQQTLHRLHKVMKSHKDSYLRYYPLTLPRRVTMDSVEVELGEDFLSASFPQSSPLPPPFQEAASSNSSLVSLPCSLVVFASGTKPHDVVYRSGLFDADSPYGKIPVDDSLRIPFTQSGLNAVYCVGDCCRCVTPLPAIAAVAETQGEYVAKRIGECLTSPSPSPSPPPYRYHPLPRLLALGPQNALFVLPSGTTLHGLFGYLAWKLVYFSLLGDWRSRIQVPIDWLKTALLGRDISTFSSSPLSTPPKDSSSSN